MTEAPAKPLPLLRRETAEKAAEKYNRDYLEKEEDPIKCHDALVDLLEQTMYNGEQRGVQCVLDFYANYINVLRKKYSSGPANHIQQGVQALLMWAKTSDSFKLYQREEKKEEVKVEADRNFIGMSKET